MNVANEPAAPLELELTRTFDAPRDLVFKVWTDPRLVASWWGLEGTRVARCEMDVRPGGAWRIDMRTPGGTVYPNGGVFLEVIENERLVYSDVADPSSPAWKDAPPGDRLNIVTFEDAGSGTRVTLRVQFGSPVDHDFFIGTGFPDGLAQSLDRLARLLQQDPRGGSGVTAGTASVDGHDMYYELKGDFQSGKIPILLLHGGMNSIQSNFRTLLPRLAASHPVIAIEQQGHGHTADRDGPISLGSMRRDTLGVLDRLHVDRVHAVGYSVGGMLALELAVFAPPRIASLTAISAGAGNRGMLPELAQLNRNPAHIPSPELQSLLPDQEAFAAMRSCFAVNPSGADHFDTVMSKMRALMASDWGWSESELRGILAPVLILIGDRDFVLPAHAVEMASMFPRAELAILPGTTHMNILERADWIVPMIEQLIGRSADPACAAPCRGPCSPAEERHRNA